MKTAERIDMKEVIDDILSLPRQICLHFGPSLIT